MYVYNVYVYVCVNVYLYANECICTRLRIRICICRCICIYVYMYMCVCSCRCKCRCRCTCTFTSICICLYAYAYVCICTYICVCMYCECMCACIQITVFEITYGVVYMYAYMWIGESARLNAEKHCWGGAATLSRLRLAQWGPQNDGFWCTTKMPLYTGSENVISRVRVTSESKCAWVYAHMYVRAYEQFHRETTNSDENNLLKLFRRETTRQDPPAHITDLNGQVTCCSRSSKAAASSSLRST